MGATRFDEIRAMSCVGGGGGGTTFGLLFSLSQLYSRRRESVILPKEGDTHSSVRRVTLPTRHGNVLSAHSFVKVHNSSSIMVELRCPPCD